MNINCTYNCKHQEDGKCSLIELPQTTMQSINAANEIDCAYYEERATSKTTTSSNYS